LWTEEGWLYLAVILDLFSRQVIGWSMSERMTADLACEVLRMAIFRRKRPKMSSFIRIAVANIVPMLTDNYCNNINCWVA
jgi:transposase InsO family protein